MFHRIAMTAKHVLQQLFDASIINYYFFFNHLNLCLVKDISMVLSVLFWWNESVFDNREVSAEFHFTRALWGFDKMFNSSQGLPSLEIAVSEAFVNNWEQLL